MPPIKVLHYSSYDIHYGAAIAAHRLHKALQKAGIESKMVVQNKTSDEKSIIGPGNNVEKALGLVRPFIDRFPLVFRAAPKNFSTGWASGRYTKYIEIENPDLVNLHWVNGGFISVKNLRRIQKPIIWTLHDSWPFTGGCHVPFECKRYTEACGMCPQISSSTTRDITYRLLKKKIKYWDSLNITIVTPSKWLGECAGSSKVFANKRIIVIPNTIDTQKFKPLEKSFARQVLNLPYHKKIILFGAVSPRSDKNKGLHHLLEALKQIRMETLETSELCVFGTSHQALSLDTNIKTNFLGRVSDEWTLALIYSAADVMVIPSIQDNLPNTVIESLACGTPCVAFSIGGMPDMIEHKKNGYLAVPFEPSDLAKGIEWVLEDDVRYNSLSSRAREKVLADFSEERVAGLYISLYREILEGASL